MTKEEFLKILEKNGKENDKSVKSIEENHTKFNQKVKSIIAVL